MKAIVVEDYDAASKEAFAVMKEAVTNEKDAILGLATSSNPIGSYKNMIQDHKDSGTSYTQCQSFNLDEYVGIDRNHPESYWTFTHESPFKGIDLSEDKIHVPYGSTKEDCEGYGKAMENISVDVQVLGIGESGHIGFNEPGAPFTEEAHIVELIEKARPNNARSFDNDTNQVPIHTITVGTATIMKVKKTPLVASDANKAGVVAAMANGPVDPACPASVLQNHENVVVVVDEAAAAKLAEQDEGADISIEVSVFSTVDGASLQGFQVYLFSIFAIIGLIKEVEVEHGDKTGSTGSGWNAADHAEDN